MANLWEDPMFKAAYANLSPADKLHYQKIGEEMYNTINFKDPKVTEFNYAMKIKLMLRDGIKVDDLTLDEKRIYTDAYGLNSLMQYKNEDVDKQDFRQVSKDPNQNNGNKINPRDSKKGRKKSKRRN